MIKQCGFVQRPAALGREEFAALWRGRHASLARQLPGLLRYTINLVPDASVEAVGWDGFAELWFEDERTMETAIASEAGVRLAEDSATTFLHRVAVLVSEEIVDLAAHSQQRSEPTPPG
jgi:uncharacterized protein (TIGR02118 family)